MIAPLLALAVTAGPAPMPSVDGAEATILVARMDRMGRMVSFLERAGRYSTLLRPTAWVSELHPLVSFDPTRPDSIAAAGIDPAAGMAISLFPEGRVSCITILDPSRYEPPAQARLAQLGAVGRAKDAGASVVVAAVKGRAVAGYVMRGKISCSTEGPRSEDLLRKTARALARPAKKAPWTSAAAAEDSAWFVSDTSTLQVTGKLDTLEVRGSSASTGAVPTLKPAGPSPYGAVPPSGLLMVRAKVAPDGVRTALGRMGAQLLAACEVCNPDVVGSLISSLRGELTGEVMLRVDRMRTPPGSLRSRPARYFAVKHASLAEVAHPEVVSTALEALIKLGAVRTAQDAYALKAGTDAEAGTIYAGLAGKQLYLANDEQALKAALTAVTSAAPAPLPHGADVFVDPGLVSRALKQVSLLDLMSSRDLAPLVAAGTELGPLLSHSELLTAWIDADGTSQRYAFTWKLFTPAASEETPAGSNPGAAPR
ncbi:MAG TPA: hypothetical protein VIG99_05075 [Myxococcaceae bacterium]